MKLNDSLRRLFLAWAATLVSVGVCLMQAQVRVDLQRPATLLHVLQHTSGVVVLLCVGWVLIEAVLLVLSPAPYRNTIRLSRGEWERRR